ncbi:long-chain-fatty-acid--CoA ligase [Sphingopyxis yananensis]|uniref:long-chain-fatty-acid--CoA ligase n=1 Tax=Sphingopyxis yananensis TaxID=2886687 RepID=UPI001D1228BA|nr:long-chain fatty acid--CoA ligase [Sphingopyxis yananensis]MCC2602848.1 long-chain fatty acid--CoA ligase [Sphingopyxis yananensis]
MEKLFDWTQSYQHPTKWDQIFQPLSLPDMLQNSINTAPDQVMLQFMGRDYSYHEVGEAVRQFAKGLQQLGIGKDCRVGLFLPNVPHYVAAYYGAMLAGATVVNFSPLYTVAELAAQVEDSGTDTLVTVSAQALLPTALKVLDQSSLKRLVVGSIAGALPPTKSFLYRLFKQSEVTKIPNDPRIIRFSTLIDNDGSPAPVSIDPERDIALIQYTGGTTGLPKGAMLTHQNLSANARQVHAIDPDPLEEDRILGVLPFFHVFANTCVLNRTVLKGGTITMLPRFDAGQALAALNKYRSTALPGVPTMYQALLDHPAAAHTDFSSLRICISGGAPMAAELREKFIARTGASLVEGYGLTESSGVVSVNPYDGPVKAGTIGQPIPATHVRLVDKSDCTKDAPAGEPGELVVKGPQIMQGYWNRPDADLDSFTPDGWLRTGDVAVIDADGYLRIVDRIKDMISVGGFKVYPSVIEAVIYEHPAIKEAIALGVPDPYRGEAPKIFVTLEPNSHATESDLTEWVNARLGKHERVVGVSIRAELPKTMIGKLDRKALRAEENV